MIFIIFILNHLPLLWSLTQFCPFPTYNENYNSPDYSLLNCENKLNSSLNRTILLIPPFFSVSPDALIFFNANYQFLDLAFRTETYQCSKYLTCNLTFFLLNSSYDFELSNDSLIPEFFQRIQGNITLQPLLCSFFQMPGCLISESLDNIIIINYKTLDFVFFISDAFIIKSLIFDGQEAISNSTNINGNLYEISALFQFDVILDDVGNLKVPVLYMENLGFQNFITEPGENNIIIANLIMNDLLGSLFMDKVSIINCFLWNSIVFYQNSSTVLLLNNSQTMVMSFNNILIDTFQQNSQIIDSQITFQAIFLIQDWSGFLQITNLSVNNANSFENDYFIICFINILYPVFLSNVSIQNNQNFGVIQLFNCNLSLINVTIFNSTFQNASITIDSLSVFISESLKVVFCVFSDENQYFFEGLGTISMENSTFYQVIDFQIIFTQSQAQISNGALIYSNSPRFFIFDTSLINFIGFSFFNVEVSISIFLFYYLENIQIINVAFINITAITSIIENQNIGTEEFSDVMFKNITVFNFFSPSPIISYLILNKVLMMYLNVYRVFYIPAKINLLFEDFYLANVNVTLSSNRGYLFQFMKTTLLMNRILYEEIVADVNCFSMFHLSGGNIQIANSSFLNIGWNNNQTYDFFSVDDNTVLYLFNEIKVTVDSCVFLSFNVSLHTGFLLFTGGLGVFQLTNSFFKHYPQEYFYNMGVIVMGATEATFINNTFDTLICPNAVMKFSYFQHINGPVAILGAAIYSMQKSNRVFISDSNNFTNCGCQNGGSLTVINYNNITITNCIFENSTSTTTGGVFSIISAGMVFINAIITQNSTSSMASVAFLNNIDSILINNSNFSNAYGIVSGCFESENTKNLTMMNIFGANFTCNGNGGFLSLMGFFGLIQNITLSNVYSIEGAFYISDSADLVLIDSSFFNFLSTLDGGVISVYWGKNITLINLLFQNITSFGNGGVLIVNIIESFNAYNLNIQNSSCSLLGILYFKCDNDSALIVLQNVGCFGNSAEKGSCIYYEAASLLQISELNVSYCYGSPLIFSYPFTTLIVISQVLMFRNAIISPIVNIDLLIGEISLITLMENVFVTQDMNIFSISNSDNFSINGLILNNLLNSSTFNEIIAFYIENSNIFLSQIVIDAKNNENCYFTIIETFQTCSIILENSIFSGINYLSSKGLITSDSSVFQLYSNSFNNSLGPIFLLTQCSISIYQSIFSYNSNPDENSPNEFDLEGSSTNKDSTFLLENCKFLNFQGLIASISDIIQFQVFNSLFENQGPFNNSYQAFELSDIAKIQFDQCQFMGFNATYGANIYLANSINSFTELFINQSLFLQGIAYLGGVLYINGDCNITIMESLFQNNKAIFNENFLSGIGGAIYFEAQTMDSSSITLINNMFVNNSAENVIQNIYSSVCLNLSNNTFTSLILENTNIFNFFSFPLNIQLNDTPQNIKSGFLFNISFEIVDCHNQTLLFESESIANLNVLPMTNTTVVIISSVSQAEQGLFSFPNVEVLADPITTFKLTISINLFNQITKTIGKLQQSFILQTSNCSQGEIILTDKACYQCPLGSYSSNDFPSEPINLCLECPLNAYCMNGYQIIPMSNYWRMSNKSRLIVQCNVQTACLGLGTEGDSIQNPDTMNVTGACKLHHLEYLCDLCEKGYGKLNENSECLECSSLKSSTIIRLFVILIFMNIFVYRSSNPQSKKTVVTLDVIFTILINYLQRVSIIVNSQTEITAEIVKDFTQAFSDMDFLSSDVFTNECFLMNLIESADKLSLYKLIGNLLLPFLLSCFCLLIFSFINYKKIVFLQQKTIHKISAFRILLFKKSLMFFLIYSFLCYGLLIKSFIDIIDCIPLDDSNTSTFVSTNPNFQCWVGLHLYTAAPVSIIGLLLWGFCFPYSLWKILKYSLILSGSLKSTNSMKSKNISIPSKNLMKSEIFDEDTYAFFYKAYKKEYYYWQCVVFVQKLLISLFAKLYPWTGFQPFQLLNPLFFIIYNYYTNKFQPFKFEKLNLMENMSVNSVFIINVSIICLNSNISDEWTWFFYIITACINLVFFGYSVYMILKFGKWKQMIETTKQVIWKIGGSITKGEEKYHVRQSQSKRVEMKMKEVFDVKPKQIKTFVKIEN